MSGVFKNIRGIITGGSPEDNSGDVLELQSDDVYASSKKAKKTSLVNKDIVESTSREISGLLKQLNKSSEMKSGISMESFVLKALEPKIAEWLNENIERLVTEIVQDEVKRILSNILE